MFTLLYGYCLLYLLLKAPERKSDSSFILAAALCSVSSNFLFLQRWVLQRTRLLHVEEAPGGWGGLARSKDPAMRALWEAEGRGCLHCVKADLFLLLSCYLPPQLFLPTGRNFSPPCSRGGWGNLNSTVSWHTHCCCASRCALAGHLFQSSITQLRKPALRPDRRCLFISAGLFSLSSWPQRWEIQHCPAGGTQGRFALLWPEGSSGPTAPLQRAQGLWPQAKPWSRNRGSWSTGFRSFGLSHGSSDPGAQQARAEEQVYVFEALSPMPAL